MMLAGTYSTSASNYLQTIFRVQTPASINGRMKDRCYVFDFAPDRTLKMVAEAGKLGIRPGATQSRTNMGAFLNFCPVIAIDGSEMKPYNVDSMLQQLKRAYASKVVASGFDDTRLYNDELLKLDDMDIKEFENLQKIIGKDKANKIDRNIVINSQGLTDEEREQLEKIEKKKKKEPLSEEEKKRLEQLKKAKEERGKAIKILRAISIRIPMLIYGMGEDFDTDITIDKFVDNIDDTSWAEFMPQGVTKAVFNKFKKYYDRDIFIAAGKQIRAKLKGADSLEPTERVKRIAEIFSSFKNTDKETVLTPWRVVNMHMSDMLGGYDFYDENHLNVLENPRFVYQGEVTDATLANTKASILEINSKSGLYPLYVAYSIFRKRLEAIDEEEWTDDLFDKLWTQTVQENVYVICKTPMAKAITRRTLLGFKGGKVNAHYFEDLVGQFKNKTKVVINKISQKSYWINGEHGIMKFDAIVGNPPYQLMDGGSKASAVPLYDAFVNGAIAFNPMYVSMIIPAKWYTGGRGSLDTFRANFLSDKRVQRIYDYVESKDCFSNVDIAGGVCYFLWNQNYCGLCEVHSLFRNSESVENRILNEFDIFIRFNTARDIVKKIQSKGESTFDLLVSSQKPFGLRTYVTPTPVGDIQLRYSGGTGPFKSVDVTANKQWINKWKVILSYLTYDHAGEFDKDGQRRIFGVLEKIPPKTVCTETYIVVHTVDTEDQADNLLSLMKTKFVRFLVSLVATTQHISKQSFMFVPQLNLNERWTDEKLYTRYGLSYDEIDFIESMIRPM